MKDKEKRNKKGSESTIGKIIYGFLLFMPLFAIGTTCLVQTFNMNAREQTETNINYKYQTNEVNSVDDIYINHLYHYDYFYTDEINTPQTDASFQMFIINIERIDDFSFDGPYIDDIGIGDEDNISYLRVDFRYTFGNSNWINPHCIFQPNNFYVDIGDLIDISNAPSFINFDFYIADIDGLNVFKTYYANYSTHLPSASTYNEIESVETTQLDENVFYRAVDKVIESPLFSWAENSIIYTTTNATCNALSITTPFIPLLLSYWLIISLMYFLYDIALMLIWTVHDKIHALKDSIT